MRYDFTGRHIEVTPAIVAHTRGHLDKLDKHLGRAPANAHVILTVEKHRHVAEIIISWRDHQFAGMFACLDMYQSVTRASDKIHKQVLKLKEKYKTRNKTSLGVASVDNEPLKPESNGAVAPRIIRSRRYQVKPMSPEEAADLVLDSKDQ